MPVRQDFLIVSLVKGRVGFFVESMNEGWEKSKHRENARPAGLFAGLLGISHAGKIKEVLKCLPGKAFCRGKVGGVGRFRRIGRIGQIGRIGREGGGLFVGVVDGRSENARPAGLFAGL